MRAIQPGVSIILATGYAELARGVETQLPRLAKPFLQRDLAASIRQVVGEAPAA
jgi:hypothetical protein